MSAPSLTIKPKALASAVATVKAGVDAKSSIQAIGGVRIVATRTAAKLVAGSSKLSVSVPISAKTVGKIDCAVLHADLTKALKMFGGFDELALTVAEHEIELRAGNRTICLRPLRVEDCFPFPSTEGDLILEAEGKEFAEALKRAYTFSCPDETRPVLCAILVDWNDGLKLVATDSYRLGAIALDAQRKVRKARKPERNRFLIGRKLADASPVLGRAKRIAITNTGTHAVVCADDATIAVRSPGGAFPDYRQLLPDEPFPHTISVPTARLSAAADIAAVFARRNAPARLNVNGAVKLYGHTPDSCSFEEILPDAKAAMGEPGEFEIGLNPEFLRDIVRTVRGDTTTIRLRGPLRPALIEDGDDEFLLMPIRLNV